MVRSRMVTFQSKNKGFSIINEDLINFFFQNKNVREVFNIAQSVDVKIWIVGGAIRNYLLNQIVNDIDFVINIDIELFLKKISKKNIKKNKRNIKYHTISIILD